MRIQISEQILESRRSEEKQLRQELEKALKKDGGDIDRHTEKVLDKWMEREDTVLDAGDIEFILDDLMM